VSGRYDWVDVEEVPLTWGTFRFVRHALGATALGFSQVDFPPGKVGSEHDEAATGQEEAYVCLAGGGTLTVDGVELDLFPGRYVLVSPDATRRPAAGPEGMSFLVVGGVPGGVYQPWDPPAE
jgi:quercetin dioxygenase-like cupin family protein